MVLPWEWTRFRLPIGRLDRGAQSQRWKGRKSNEAPKGALDRPGCDHASDRLQPFFDGGLGLKIGNPPSSQRGQANHEQGRSKVGKQPLATQTWSFERVGVPCHLGHR